jgi:hypothetical protein
MKKKQIGSMKQNLTSWRKSIKYEKKGLKKLEIYENKKREMKVTGKRDEWLT